MSEMSLLKAFSSVLPSREPAGTSESRDSQTTVKSSYSLKVVEILLNTFVEQVLGGKRENSATAQKFLEAQMKDYEKRLRTAEDRLAEFKKRNIGLMPTEGASYFSQLQAELDAASKANRKINRDPSAN